MNKRKYKRTVVILLVCTFLIVPFANPSLADVKDVVEEENILNEEEITNVEETAEYKDAEEIENNKETEKTEEPTEIETEEKTAEIKTTEQPTEEPPITEPYTVEQSTIEPVTEQSTAEPITEQSTTRQITTEQPTTVESESDKPDDNQKTDLENDSPIIERTDSDEDIKDDSNIVAKVINKSTLKFGEDIVEVAGAFVKASGEIVAMETRGDTSAKAELMLTTKGYKWKLIKDVDYKANRVINEDGTVTFSYNILKENFCRDGLYKLEIVDQSDGKPKEYMKFGVDTKPPTAKIVTPKEGAVGQVGIILRDNYVLENVRILIDDAEYRRITGEELKNIIKQGGMINLDASGLKEGRHDIKVESKDGSGNVSVTSSVINSSDINEDEHETQIAAKAADAVIKKGDSLTDRSINMIYPAVMILFSVFAMASFVLAVNLKRQRNPQK